jgi:hypothetical protein
LKVLCSRSCSLASRTWALTLCSCCCQTNHNGSHHTQRPAWLHHAISVVHVEEGNGVV